MNLLARADSLLDRLFEPAEKRIHPAQVTEKWLQSLGLYGDTSAGVDVTENNALESTAVFACVRILAESVASLPLLVYRRLANGGKERAPRHRLYPLLHDLPNAEMTSVELRETLMGHVALWGNAYAEKELNRAGQVIGLWPLRPDRVRIERVDRKLAYRVQMPAGPEMTLPAERVMHVRGLGYDGVRGYSPISKARQAVGLSLATEEFGARFFGNGARPGAVLEHPGILGDKAQERLRDSWNETHQGLSKAHRVAILEEGMKLHEVGIPPEDAQFLECVIPGTLITMADGTRKPVEALQGDDSVMAWADGIVLDRVLATGEPPIKPLVKIVTHRGRELTATVDHLFLAKHQMRTAGGRPDRVAAEWIDAGELRPGYYVRVALGHAAAARWQMLDSDTAWLLGALVGDGYVRKGGCTFTNQDSDIVERANEILKRFGGGLRESRSRAHNYEICTGGRGRGGSHIRTLLKDAKLIDKGAAEKRVPEMVLRGGPQVWSEFLAGYFDADGSVQGIDAKGQPLAYWSSVNRPLLEDCQHMLAMLGINSGIYLMSSGGERRVVDHISNIRPQWGLYVTGASQLRLLAAAMRPESTAKRTKLESLLDLPESQYREENWQYDRVKSVEFMEPGPTVGVEIAATHTHATAGLITHNTRKFQVTEIARLYRIPPHMLADLDRATFSNIEHQSLEFVIHTLRPWLVRWEQAIYRDLLRPQERSTYFAEHLIDGLLRGDIKSRYDAYAVGRQNGWLSANDVRRFENMNPIDDGDVYLIPLNMIPAGQAGEPDTGSGSRMARNDAKDGGLGQRRLTATTEREVRARNVAKGRLRLAQSYEKLYRDGAARVVRREVSDVRRAIRGHFGERSQRDVTSFLDWLRAFYLEHREFWVKQLLPLVLNYADMVGADVGTELGLELAGKDIETFLDQYIETLAIRETASSETQLRALISEALEAGEDPVPVVEERLQGWEETRAGKVANRESRTGLCAMAVALYGASRVVERFVVVNVGDSCAYCQALNDLVVGLNEIIIAKDEEFQPEGADRPLTSRTDIRHPQFHDGCDCQIVAEIG